MLFCDTCRRGSIVRYDLKSTIVMTRSEGEERMDLIRECQARRMLQTG